LREVFGPDESVDVLAKRLIDHHPEMMLEDHFVIKHKNRIVACLNLIPEKWCIGEIPLKVAEMGCVGTLPEFRHRGLIRMLVKEFHKRVATHGYDLSVIEGIPYFYRQFGYEYAIPLDEEITIRLDQIPDYELKQVIRPFTERDIPKAMQLLKQAQQKFYVHSVRDKQIWKMQHETGMASSPNKFEGYAVEEKGERARPEYLGTLESPYNGERLQSQVHAMFLQAFYGVNVRLVNPDGNTEIEIQGYNTSSKVTARDLQEEIEKHKQKP
jgi:predicted N-acetyltransferase YhbS